jgi:hypothetical protein
MGERRRETDLSSWLWMAASLLTWPFLVHIVHTQREGKNNVVSLDLLIRTPVLLN